MMPKSKITLVIRQGKNNLYKFRKSRNFKTIWLLDQVPGIQSGAIAAEIKNLTNLIVVSLIRWSGGQLSVVS
jgi:hypothetical protein